MEAPIRFGRAIFGNAPIGATIVSGVGFQPISEHYKEDFGELRRKLRADQFQVSDC